MTDKPQGMELKIRVTPDPDNLPPGYEITAMAKQDDGSLIYTVQTPGSVADEHVLFEMFGDCVYEVLSGEAVEREPAS